MYNFVDTNGYAEGTALPSEALKINGAYLENKVTGYRTLYVKGREMLAPDIETHETGVRDGSTLQSKRFPARTITVGYQLIASSAEAFRAAFNALNAALDVEEAELIFADEPDKFFIGTPSGRGDVPEGRNAITGEFDILCVDPFKYSVQEYEATPTLDDGTTFVIQYNGTYRSYPTLVAEFADEDDDTSGGLTGNGDCGYVAFLSDDAAIIQLGDPDEPDTENYAKSQTLTKQIFTSYNATVAAKWPINTGRTSSSAVTATGTVVVGKDAENIRMLVANSYGTGTEWHGPSITRTIPADASGHVGAKNFRLSYKQRMCMGQGKKDTKQRGLFQCLLVNVNGSERTIVAGLSVNKNKTGKQALLKLYVNGKTVHTQYIDLTYHNKYFGYKKVVTEKIKKKGKVIKKKRIIQPVLSSTIRKYGKTVTFNIGGIKKAFKVSAIANTEVHEITFLMGKYASVTPLTYNGLFWAKFISDSCETFRDIPNKFSAGDVVEADCEDGEIYLNDARAPELGALGNDWETFYLEPGANQIGVVWSDWVPAGSAPNCKIRYREVFL